MSRTQGVCSKSPPKKRKVTLIESSIDSSVYLSSKTTASSVPYGPCNKIESLPEDTWYY